MWLYRVVIAACDLADAGVGDGHDGSVLVAVDEEGDATRSSLAPEVQFVGSHEVLAVRVVAWYRRTQ